MTAEMIDDENESQFGDSHEHDSFDDSEDYSFNDDVVIYSRKVRKGDDSLDEHVENFVLDNIRVIDFQDMAKLIGINEERLKNILGEMGIKLPVEHARKWNDIETGTYKSPEHCAKCQVQLLHRSFFVDEQDCRKCYEKNIPYWVTGRINIRLKFPVKK